MSFIAAAKKNAKLKREYKKVASGVGQQGKPYSGEEGDVIVAFDRVNSGVKDGATWEMFIFKVKQAPDDPEGEHEGEEVFFYHMLKATEWMTLEESLGRYLETLAGMGADVEELDGVEAEKERVCVKGALFKVRAVRGKKDKTRFNFFMTCPLDDDDAADLEDDSPEDPADLLPPAEGEDELEEETEDIPPTAEFSEYDGKWVSYKDGNYYTVSDIVDDLATLTPDPDENPDGEVLYEIPLTDCQLYEE